MTDELVVVGVDVLVEADPQAERARKIKRSKVPMIAFESVTRRDECGCVIRVVLSSHLQEIDLSDPLLEKPLHQNIRSRIHKFVI